MTLAIAAGSCQGSRQQPRTDVQPDAQPTATAIEYRVIEDLHGAETVTGSAGTLDVPAELAAHVPDYVLQLRKFWAPGQLLRVCFFGGSELIRRRIRDAAVVWLKHGNLVLDFGSPAAMRSCSAADPSDIRIGFGYPGYWSVVGNTPVDVGVQTMNYGMFDTTPPSESRFSAIVLHEFGHAFGFLHEQQRPRGGCDDEFNWPFLYTELAKPPNVWPTAKVDSNLRALKDSAAYGVSAADRTSIMQYSLEPWMFRTGERSKCYISDQFALSRLDMKGMAFAYPKNASLAFAERRRRIERLIESLPSEATSARRYLQTVIEMMEPKRIAASRPQ